MDYESMTPEQRMALNAAIESMTPEQRSAFDAAMHAAMQAMLKNVMGKIQEWLRPDGGIMGSCKVEALAKVPPKSPFHQGGYVGIMGQTSKEEIMPMPKEKSDASTSGPTLTITITNKQK